jgi:hypothetical protein
MVDPSMVSGNNIAESFQYFLSDALDIWPAIVTFLQLMDYPKLIVYPTCRYHFIKYLTFQKVYAPCE